MPLNDPRILGNPGTAAFRVDYYPFYLLNRVVSRYNPIIEATLRPIGIDIPSWRVLMILGENAPRGIAEIADAAVINISTMTRIVQRMTRDGLLVRIGRADDQRITDVDLTPLGQEKLTASRLAVSPVYSVVTSGFSKQEFEQLVALLNRLYCNLGVAVEPLAPDEAVEDGERRDHRAARAASKV